MAEESSALGHKMYEKCSPGYKRVMRREKAHYSALSTVNLFTSLAVSPLTGTPNAGQKVIPVSPVTESFTELSAIQNHRCCHACLFTTRYKWCHGGMGCI